jgi:hypothetical protein
MYRYVCMYVQSIGCFKAIPIKFSDMRYNYLFVSAEFFVLIIQSSASYGIRSFIARVTSHSKKPVVEYIPYPCPIQQRSRIGIEMLTCSMLFRCGPCMLKNDKSPQGCHLHENEKINFLF